MKHLTQAEWDELQAYKAEAQRLHALINTPEIEDFLRGVQLEAVHQVERFGTEHDAGKEPRDFFWLIAHLATRAMDHHTEAKRLAAQGSDLGGEILMDQQADHHQAKALHHCITTAAAMFHWWAQIKGVPTTFRPGLDPAAAWPLPKREGQSA